MATGDANSTGSGTIPASSSGGSPNSTADGSLAGSFQSFLTLLTTPLESQCPDLKTDDELAALVLLQHQTALALAFVGKIAVVRDATATIADSRATWNLDIPSNCSLTIDISDSVGQIVFTGIYSAAAGDSQPFTWNGRSSDGTQRPDGLYKLTAMAIDASGNPVAIKIQTRGLVSSADLTQRPPLLSIDGRIYTINQVQHIVN
jgi:flagellar basal-body rod modification protein FlgD